MRLLASADARALRDVLEQDPYYTLFMLGDLDVMGMEHRDLVFWGQYDGEALCGVAMRYKRHWLFYSAGRADLGAFARLVDAYPDDSMISGRPSLVREVLDRIVECSIAQDRACTLSAMPRGVVLAEPGHPTRRATVRDVPALVRHFEEADTMRRDAAGIHEALEQMRIYVTMAKDRIVATALTNAETSSMAMIGGVYTPPPLRNRGYATAAVAGLCQSLLSDSLQPCLIWDNPTAGRIYHQLGFEDIGRWAMVSLQRG